MFFKKILEPIPKERVSKNRRLLLSNERTFLSWIRTSIGIMAFGFMLERFEHFLFLSKNTKKEDYLVYFYAGLFLVFIGASISILAAYRFIKIQKEILNDNFKPSFMYDILLAVLLSSIGFLLLIYLLR